MNLNGSMPQNSGVTVKAVLSMSPCLVCLYVNGVMLFSLGRRAAFLESSRYLLFGHLLLTDSAYLLLCMLLYLFAMTGVRLTNILCVLLLLLAQTVNIASPLTLALMSLERYVAICLPLRHGRIATKRCVGAALAAAWYMAAVDPLTEAVYYGATEDRTFLMQRFCIRGALLGRGFFSDLNTAFNLLYFLLVAVVIAYTYISILTAARSAAATSRAGKARKTVLLHMLQLCLCLSATMYNMMNYAAMLNVSYVKGLHIQYSLFLCLIIFPRFLSPLIYGLRDHAFRRVFRHYFLLGLSTHRKSVV